MIVEELKAIASRASQRNLTSPYIRSLLKEHLQIYVLNLIYTSQKYRKNFIFTGGTCLRHCFGLNRLSEDLDFDLKTPIDAGDLKQEVDTYFRSEWRYTDLQVAILQQGKQILLKFPVLRQLGLASASESDLLFVKIDLSPLPSEIFAENTTLRNTNNFTYIVTHYDLPSLMASKIAAVLTRQREWGRENTKIVKGRDYFDLLWFLEKKTYPTFDRTCDILGAQYTPAQLLQLIDNKVNAATGINRLSFKQDLLPYIDNSEVIDGYIESYKENYDRAKAYLVTPADG
jgi:hypothetical protein